MKAIKNYESFATLVAKRLNEKFGEKIFFVIEMSETYCLIQNLYYDYKGNDVGVMISDEGIECSITGLTVKFANVDDLIDRIDELFGKKNKSHENTKKSNFR